MPRGLWFALPLLLLAGCHSVPLSQTPTVTSVSACAPSPGRSLALEVRDNRPRWEHYGSEGAWSFVPLEDVGPSFWRDVQAEVERAVQQRPDPPCRAVVQLRSFRVLIVDEDKVRAQEEEEARWIFGTELDLEADSLQDVAAEAVAWIFVTSLKAGAVGLDHALTDAAQRQGWLKQPPRRLYRKYAADVSCDIRARVTLSWPDGRQREAELHVLTNNGPTGEGDSNYRGEQISSAVHAAAVHLADEVRAQLMP